MDILNKYNTNMYLCTTGKLEKDPLTKDDYLDTECLDLYILSEHVKKKMTKFTCLNAEFPWILDWNCNFVKYWELYILMIVIYICLVYPYCIGFKKEFPGGIFFYLEIIVTISLILNIVMTSITAIRTKKKCIRNMRAIVSYRLNTLGIYLDLLAIIPIEHLVTIHTLDGYRDEYRNNLFYLCKGVKLCLVWRLSNFFENLERKLLLNTIVVKVKLKFIAI